MADWTTIIPLAVQIPFVLLMAFILDRQAKLGVELFKYLMAEFKTINQTQAERHQAITETLLGLVDELASRANPDKITHRQFKELQDYLAEQVKK